MSDDRAHRPGFEGSTAKSNSLTIEAKARTGQARVVSDGIAQSKMAAGIRAQNRPASAPRMMVAPDQ